MKICLDKNNREFKLAWQFINSTTCSLFLTGKAGTGKTTLLRYIQKRCRKRMAILASTGIAAIHCGGQTIHSFFQLPSRLLPPDDPCFDPKKFAAYFHYNSEKSALISNLETIIIDEVSMVRCDVMDAVNTILQIVRKNQKPFGGIQMVLIGDVFQLPPVCREEDWQILQQYYPNMFFFSSHVIQKNPLIYLELHRVYRQSDVSFVRILNRIREGQADTTDLQYLNKRCPEHFKSSDYIHVCTHNRMVKQLNDTGLSLLQTRDHCFRGERAGVFDSRNFPAEQELHLKVGARVMFLVNDWNVGYYNGQMGKIEDINDKDYLITIMCDNGARIFLQRKVWKTIHYTWNEKRYKVEKDEIGSYTQFPLRLAWAITIHKSQGLTFHTMVLNANSIFETGQMYVALSRCSSFEDLVLKRPVTKKDILVNENAIVFSRRVTSAQAIQRKLTLGKAYYLYLRASEALRNAEIKKAFYILRRAVRLWDISDRAFFYITLKDILKEPYIKQQFLHFIEAKNDFLNAKEIKILSTLWESEGKLFLY